MKELELKVSLRNKLNALLDELEPKFLAIMEKWEVGDKVWKTSGEGGPVKKLRDQFDIIVTDIQNRDWSKWKIRTPYIHIRSELSGIWVNVRMSSDEGGTYHYDESSFRIGTRSRDNGELTDKETGLTFPDHRKQYEIEQVINTIDIIKALKQEIIRLESSISEVVK